MEGTRSHAGHPPSESADALKQVGDVHFRQGEYELAAHAYSRALASLPQGDPHLGGALHANRCLALLKCGQGAEALREALDACRLRPRWGKAWLRLGQAREAASSAGEAAAAYSRAAELDPSLAVAAGKALAGLERHATRQRCQATLRGHQGPVYDAAVSPVPVAVGSFSTHLVATAGADASVRLFCSITGRQLQQLQGHQDMVTCVEWSPCGSLLASASLDGTARLWRSVPPATIPARDSSVLAGSSAQLQSLLEPGSVLGGHSGRVSCLAFSPDSSLLATGSSEGQVQVWAVGSSSDTSSGVEKKFEGRCSALVTAVDFSPCGTLLAAASGDGQFIVWAALTGAIITEVAWESGPVNFCRFVQLPPGIIAPAMSRGIPPGPADPMGPSEAQQEGVPAAATAALLLTCHVQLQRREGRIGLWDVLQRRHGWVDGKLTAPLASLDNFRGKVTSVDSWLPGAGSDSTGSDSNRRHAGSESGHGAAEPHAAGVTSEGLPLALLSTACTDGSVRLFDLAGIAAAAARGTGSKTAAAAPLLELALPDAAQAPAAGTAGSWQGSAPAWSTLSIAASAHSSDLAALSPDGRLLACVGPDRRILVVGTEGSEQQLALAAHEGTVRVLRWLGPHRLLSAGEDGVARVWNMQV